MSSLYTIRSGYQVIKFDSDLNHEITYAVSEHGCTCPAGHNETCRHREMLQLFRETDKVDSGWFIDWDRVKWHEPVGVMDE